MNDVTRILSSIEHGDALASEQLLPLVYDELRRLAAQEFRNESSDHTLQPTALVHEAYLRLIDQKNEPKWDHRGHFYAAAAEAMRRILVEHARRKKAQKRGGSWAVVPLPEELVSKSTRTPDLIALSDALEDLAKSRPQVARLVSLRYFAGLSVEQAAMAMDVSRRTAERNWTYAKAWLLQALRDQDSSDK